MNLELEATAGTCTFSDDGSRNKNSSGLAARHTEFFLTWHGLPSKFGLSCSLDTCPEVRAESSFHPWYKTSTDCNILQSLRCDETGGSREDRLKEVTLIVIGRRESCLSL